MFSSKLRVAVIALLILGGRCHATGQDAVSAQNNSQDQSIISDIQAKLFSDSVLKTLDIRVFCKDGAVTLAGSVETDLERAAVERIARQEPGVSAVLNNLAVVKSPDGAADTTNSAPAADSTASPNNAAPDSNDSNADANNSTPAVSAAVPAPAITLPSGTPLTVRMIDDVDSATTKVGDAFHASLENALVVGEVIVAPKGADVYGKLVRVKQNGKIAGAGKLTLELTGIQVRGQLVAIDSETYEVVGKGRGKGSAETIGGGAAAGAAIGGIAGGGAGAVIGAAAGAGGGTLIQLLRHRDQLRVPSETLLEFKLQQAVDIPAVAPAPEVPAAAETPAPPAEPAVSTEPAPAEDPSPAAGSLRPARPTPPVGGHGNTQGGPDLIEDNFATDTVLNVSQWQTNTPLLAALAQAESSGLVDPRLSFDAFGMKIAGVSGTYQLTGIQSAASFSPPFTARVTVKGTIAHGNAFSFYITNNDLSQGIRLEGNLNPGNGQYRGLWIAHGRAPGDDVYRQTSLNQWYTVVVSVDANGTGAATISDARGAVLASRSGLPVGTGPFFVVLGQREGAPFTVGPNEAIWASVTVQATAASAPADAITVHVGSATDDPPDAPAEARTGEKGDIHSVDFRNFLYHPACSDRKAIRVKDSRWKGGTDDSPEYFEVVTVKYGDLTGDGRDEAVVLGACSGIANFQVGDVFVYSDETGAPQLLAELSPPDWGKGEQDNGGDFQISEIRVRNQQLAISFYAGGSHAGPEWVVTARFRWSGSRFERVGIDRKPFTVFSRP
jgi:hypothetical protein